MINRLKISIFLFSFLFLIFLIGWFYFPAIANLSIVLIIVAVLAIVFGILWSKELETGLLILITSLFFERLPTLEVSGFSLKISLIIGAGLIIAWMIKKMTQWRHPELDSGSPRNEILKLVQDDKMIKAIYISLLIFWLINLISLLINPIAFRNIIIFLLITFNLILFFVISNLDIQKETLTKIAKILIIGSVLVCIFALWQYFGDLAGIGFKWTFLREHYAKQVFGFPRVQGTFLEPMLFANFLLIPIFLSVSLWLKNKIKNSLFIPSFFLFLSVLILTLSRSAYLALVIGMILLAVLAFKDIFKWKKFLMILLTIIISIGFSLALIRIGGGSDAFQKFILQNSELIKKPQEQGYSTQQRLDTYRFALEAFKEKPIFGIGPGGFGKYFAQKNPIENSGETQTVNNEYLEILAENGIAGLISFAIFLISIIFYALKKYYQENNELFKALVLGLFLTIIAIFIQYNFFSSIYIIYIWVILGLLTNKFKFQSSNVK